MNKLIKRAKNRMIRKITHKMTGKISVVRLKRLIGARKVKKYALIGHPLIHSISPLIHKSIMKKVGILGTYRLYDIPIERFKEDIHLFLDQFDGFNITIPYKEKIFPLLKNTDENTSQVKAVNTVCGNVGYNTDITGFRYAGIKFNQKRVLLLGSGGVARIMISEAARGNARAIIVSSRNKQQAEKLIADTISHTQYTNIQFEEESHLSGHFDIILNATPLGMWPHCDRIPVSEDIIRTASYVFDSIYNPSATRLLLKARSFGIKSDNGLMMLVQQALEAQKIWNPQADFSRFDSRSVRYKIQKQLIKKFPIKIVLAGFMGSGKTTIGKKLAKAIGLKFADLDLMIVEENRKTIASIFREKGEIAFRQSEKRCLKKILHETDSLVISSGGGALIDPENVSIVRKNNGFIFYLKVPFETVMMRVGDKEDRPLIIDKDRESIRMLYEKRQPIYDEISDYILDGTQTPNQIVRQICKALELPLEDSNKSIISDESHRKRR